MRKVDISHSGQTVAEAMEQLIGAIESARRGGDPILLVVHGFGASGVGGAIKDAVVTELPGLAGRYGFKAYGQADKDRLPRQQNIDARLLNPGSTLIMFPEAGVDRESKQEFRPNFRNLRSTVRVPVHPAAASRMMEPCVHRKGKLVSRGPGGSTYRCRRCGKTYLVPAQGEGGVRDDR